MTTIRMIAAFVATPTLRHMDESDIASQSELRQENYTDATAVAAAAAATESMTATGINDSLSQNSRSRFAAVAAYSSYVAESLNPTSRRHTSARSTEGREVHHVTFAEPCNKYVHSDSGIVLSPDDTDFNDVTGDGQSQETDDETEAVDDEATGQTERPSPGHSAVTNKQPGRPIIKLHRCRSTDSRDNPFLSDGELHRKADYIVAHSTFLRSYVRVADPDQIPIEPTQNEAGKDDDDNNSTSQQLQQQPQRQDSVRDKPNSTTIAAINTHLGTVDLRCQSGSSSPDTTQPVISMKQPPPIVVVRNGEVEESLLTCKKEGNFATEASRSKLSQSKKHNICCILQ